MIDKFFVWLAETSFFQKKDISWQDLKSTTVQFIKFGMVGILNTLISLLIYYICLFLKMDYLLSQTIGFLISTINAFFWNNKVVFVAKKTETRNVFTFLKVLSSYTISYFLNIGLLYIQVDKFSISDKIAPLINLVITIPLNFILNKFWAFKKAD